eukprot:CAMPEP_0197196280 /NCGR_PEP_ID=MMETSP1423-20130617/32269_1 /TAXON_ID=476441 /ORGANISM="Pseudo-nitzschia heimii, Strain UNC1101" /LENGTH=311 /DNA_ID=CAMNT_0042650065 /DNA_START=45 /DNA_END=981 /DNA_ORIENTATION=-
MKIVSKLKLCLGAALVAAAASSPLSSVQVTLKGKKYRIDDVTTVSELQQRLEEQSGIVPSKQGKILHNGKRISTDADSLSEAGVSEGDQLSCVPSKKSSSKKKSSSTTTAAAEAGVSEGDQLSCVPSKKSSSKKKSSSTTTAAADAAGASDPMADMMKGLTGAGGLDEMVQKMLSGGMGGGPGGMPDMKESMKMMKDLTNSQMFEDYMNDPEKLEESRQMILSNPMMKSMMASMPGMSDLLEDKDAWAQTMIAAAGIMKQMDPEDMVKMMEAQASMGGGGMPPGMGGMGGGAGLFGNGASSALDELSEGED